MWHKRDFNHIFSCLVLRFGFRPRLRFAGEPSHTRAVDNIWETIYIRLIITAAVYREVACWYVNVNFRENMTISAGAPLVPDQQRTVVRSKQKLCGLRIIQNASKINFAWLKIQVGVIHFAHQIHKFLKRTRQQEWTLKWKWCHYRNH